MYQIYKIVTQQVIYSQLVHSIETHDIGIVHWKMGQVVGGDEFDDKYDHCILPLNNGGQPD